MISSGMTDLKFYLTYDGVTTLLENSPDGWDEQLMKWERSVEYFGLFRSFSISLKWVRDGAEILRRAFYTDGIDAAVTVRMDKRNRQTNLFEAKYTGVIDFVSFSDSRDFVECIIKDTGAASFFVNRKDTKETITLPTTNQLTYTAPVALYESVKALNVTQNYLGFSGSGDYLTDTPPGVGPIWPTQEFQGPALHEVQLLMGENNFKNINNCLVFFDANDFYWGSPFSYTEWFRATRNCQARVTIRAGEIKFWARQTTQTSVPSDAINFRVKMILRTGSGDTVIDSWSQIGLAGQFGTWVSVVGASDSIDKTVTLETGNKILITVEAKSDNLEHFDFCFQSPAGGYDAQCDIYADLLPYTIYPITAIELFQELCSRMSGGAVQGISTYLTDNPILLTSGDGLRSVNDATLVTTFNDFFKFLWSIKEVGFGIETINGIDYYVLEELSHFFDSSTLSFDLGSNINNVEISVAQEFIFSQITAGPPDGKYEDAFGKDEFNQEEQWKLPVLNRTNELQLTSPYHTDCLSAAWQIRQQFFETAVGGEVSEKRDSEKDNDIFVIMGRYLNTVSGIDYYEIDRSTYQIYFVTYPDYMYNAALTPKRCILNHGKYLASAMWPGNGTVTFQSGKRNYIVWTENIITGELLQEKADFSVTNFGTRLFIPLYLQVEGPMIFTYAETANRYGYVTLEYRGVVYKGYIMDMEARVSKDQSGAIKLLLVEQDISNLIH